MESIRVAQRSIMMRAVVRPCVVADETHEYAVERGVTIATLLPLTNCPAGSDLAVYDPDRWSRRRLRGRPPARGTRARDHVRPRRAHVPGAAVLARGDDRGAHVVRRRAFDASLAGPVSAPRRAQIGGIARPEHPCEITYTHALTRRRTRADVASSGGEPLGSGPPTRSRDGRADEPIRSTGSSCRGSRRGRGPGGGSCATGGAVKSCASRITTSAALRFGSCT